MADSPTPNRSPRTAPGSGAARAGHRTPTRWRQAAYAALFVLLALTAVQCARLGLAGLFVQTAQREIDRSTAVALYPGMAAFPVRMPGTRAIRDATHYFSNSLEYTADNPWALEGMGTLNLASMRISRTPRQALDVTRTARLRFRQALQQRPTSPFLWANLALSKLYLDEPDEELLTALRYADALGPWEPSVQQTVLFVGLATWQSLDAELRAALVRSLERGALRNRQKMFEIAKSYRRFDLVCAIRKYEDIAGPACAKAAATAVSGEPIRQGFRR